MPRLRATTLITALVLSACSGTAAPTATLAPSLTATATLATPSAVATPSEVALADGVTALEFGCLPTVARCQNMPAATYETWGWAAFLPGLTLTLPAGWSSMEQDAGEFELHQAIDVEAFGEIYFWSDIVPWVDGEERPDLGTTADGFATFLLGDERLTVSEGPTRTFAVRSPDSLGVVGTVEARSFSVIVSEAAETESDVAFDCPAEACIGLLRDPVHWHPGSFELLRDMPTDAGCLCSQAVRLYIADIGRDMAPHTLFIALSTFGADPLATLSNWETQVEPIIDSVLVPYIVVDN